MEITTILYILLIHWIADFICQDEEWAVTKSNSIISLVTHTYCYSMVFLIFFMLYCGYYHINPLKSLYFVGVTFILHTITDYFTSKIVAKQFKNKKYGSSVPNFGAFTTIGLDQYLHQIQLILTFQYFFYG